MAKPDRLDPSVEQGTRSTYIGSPDLITGLFDSGQNRVS